MNKLNKLPFIKGLYTLYCLLSYLLLPFATVPIGALVFWMCSGALPALDAKVISLGISPFTAAFITSCIIAPVYCLFIVIIRSEMNLSSQIILHLFFSFANMALLFYINFDTRKGLSPYFLAMLPQQLILHTIHIIWVHKYRDINYRKLLSIVKKTRE